ncbi:hypothetical protein D3C81_1464450 [compost metagenome]
MQRSGALAALQQQLRRAAGKLLEQLQFADRGRQRWQLLEQALQVADQQQGAQHAAVGIAHGGGAVQQPALADAVGLGGRCGPLFGAAQQVEGGEVQRCAARFVELRAAAAVQLHVEQLGVVAEQAGGRLAAAGGIGGQGRAQFGMPGDVAGVLRQLLQALLQRPERAGDPGLGQLLAVLRAALLLGVLQQRAAGQQAEQAAGGDGQQAGAQGARRLRAGHGGGQCWPLWPKPPAPRRLSSNCSTSSKRACTTGTSTSWARRSPTAMVKALCPRFQQDTISSPW